MGGYKNKKNSYVSKADTLKNLGAVVYVAKTGKKYRREVKINICELSAKGSGDIGV